MYGRVLGTKGVVAYTGEIARLAGWHCQGESGWDDWGARRHTVRGIIPKPVVLLTRARRLLKMSVSNERGCLLLRQEDLQFGGYFAGLTNRHETARSKRWKK